MALRPLYLSKGGLIAKIVLRTNFLEKSLNKNIPAITKLVAPLLLADTPIYIKLTKELGDTADDKQRLLTYLTDTGIPENILESVKNLIF